MTNVQDVSVLTEFIGQVSDGDLVCGTSTSVSERKRIVPTRDVIVKLQDKMTELIAGGDMKSVEDDCVLTHYFTDGAYARELKMPAGAIIVGKIHKHSHLNFITEGKVAVATEFGEEVFTAPHTFVSLPGTKRVVYILEDTTWTTVHVTNETDLEKIEDHVIAKSYEEYEAFKALEFKKDEL